jgi:hypothetical protein
MLTKIKYSVAILLLTLLLLMSYFWQKQQALSVDRTACTFDQGHCQIHSDKGSIRFESFPESMAIEEEINVKITFPNELKLKQVFITGVNMYMGKTRVLFDEQDIGVAQGVFFLGSCSEPNMRWQMTLELEDYAGVVSRYYGNFATFR